MYTFLVLFLFGLVGSSPTGKSADNVRIVGGEDIDIAEAPYQVSVAYRGRHSCGGTIVANDVIVTAAHCLMGSNPSDYTIRAGSPSSTAGGAIYPVGSFLVNPDFSYMRMDSDIALIWLAKPLEFGENIAAIDMMDDDEEIPDGAETEVTGWGNTREGGGFPATLQKVLVPKVNDRQCYKAYAPSYTITPRMLCAGSPKGGKDACQGDSGGPMVYNGKLAGVVSWGLGCARPDYPGVYAKVSALRTWLDDHIAYLRLKYVLRAFP
ncbi:vitellin-degrading protease-like [Plodia interpunctella]|uniref:vitellin-degrading protease-like n=1 Tax=Plodia interpunctella TaxID=58824 RepID=UPI0023689570|nr:vitellin-degrading protease-like [Plodia interpunctella]